MTYSVFFFGEGQDATNAIKGGELNASKMVENCSLTLHRLRAKLIRLFLFTIIPTVLLI